MRKYAVGDVVTLVATPEAECGSGLRAGDEVKITDVYSDASEKDIRRFAKGEALRALIGKRLYRITARGMGAGATAAVFKEPRSPERQTDAEKEDAKKEGEAEDGDESSLLLTWRTSGEQQEIGDGKYDVTEDGRTVTKARSNDLIYTIKSNEELPDSDFTIQICVDAVGDDAPASGLVPKNFQYEYNSIGFCTKQTESNSNTSQGGPLFFMASGEVPHGFERARRMPGWHMAHARHTQHLASSHLASALTGAGPRPSGRHILRRRTQAEGWDRDHFLP